MKEVPVTISLEGTSGEEYDWDEWPVALE